eukprot:Em0013g320a
MSWIKKALTSKRLRAEDQDFEKEMTRLYQMKAICKRLYKDMEQCNEAIEEPPRSSWMAEEVPGHDTVRGRPTNGELLCYRRMFPGFSVSISGLKPKAKYAMKLEVILASCSRFKFLNAHWLAVGAAEPQPQAETYLHPDSPNSGAFWMRHGVSFRKLKITNNKEKPGGNILLHSMHKYSLRLVVDEESKAADKPPPPPKNVLSMDFPETTFIAVTAYQNEEVTQLKISNNPFAKAFRETSADLDWETAQALYGNAAVFSPMAQFSPQAIPGYFPPPNPWYMHSSIPPTPSPSFHSSLALQGNYPGFSSPHPLPPQLRHEFQWPQTSLTHRIIDTEDYTGETHSVYTVPTSATCAHLPDFESVFVMNPQTPTSP